LCTDRLVYGWDQLPPRRCRCGGGIPPGGPADECLA